MTYSNPSNDIGRFAYEGLERVFHEKARLGIMTSLMGHPGGILFNDVKSLCALTDGNLSRHLHTLTSAGLVSTTRQVSKKGGRAQTLICLTENGRERFTTYLDLLEQVMRDAAAAQNKWSENSASDAGYAAS